MGLPTSREETATTAAVVKSATINAIQDAIIGGKKASTQLLIPALAFKFQQSAWNVVTVGGHYIEPTASTGFLAIDGVEVGDRITGLEWRGYGNGTTDVTYTLYAVSSSGAYTTLGTLTDTNRGAAWGTNTVTITPHVMAAGESLLIEASANGTGYRIGTATLTYDRL